MMRDFEKISFAQFQKDIQDNALLYANYLLPQRDSESTAGYDIYLLEELVIKPNEIKKIPTGLKSFFEKDEVLFLIVRSSTGFKYNIRLCNQVGVIDSDYYNNQDNEGHIWLKVQNEGNEIVTIPKGESIVQGIFLKYLTTQSDRNCGQERRTDY